MDLKNKNVIYFGGFGGIGQKCLDNLLGKSIQSLIVCDLQENNGLLELLQNSYPNTKILYIPVDVRDSSSIDNAYELAAKQVPHNHIDVIINGCGIFNDRLIDLTIDINLRGVIYSSLKALDYMDKSKGGKGGVVVNISSVVGLEPAAAYAIYSATKCGVTAFTRAMADRLYYSHTGVSFITICPGLTDTTLLQSLHSKATLTEYVAPVIEKLTKVSRQSASICAELIVKVVEINKNGSVWIISDGKLEEMEFSVLWKPKIQQ